MTCDISYTWDGRFFILHWTPLFSFNLFTSNFQIPKSSNTPKSINNETFRKQIPAPIKDPMNTLSAFLNLTPQFASVINALEVSFPAPKSGPSKLNTFINLALGIFAVGGPLAAAGINGPHDPVTVTQLATIFASTIVQGINQAKNVNSTPSQTTTSINVPVQNPANVMVINQPPVQTN